MPTRPRRGHSRYQMTESEAVELLVGHPGPRGSVFPDHEARAVAADRLPDVLADASRLSLMQIRFAVERARDGHWGPGGGPDVPITRRPA